MSGPTLEYSHWLATARDTAEREFRRRCLQRMAAQHEEALASAGPTLPANEPHLAKSAAANPRKNAEARRRWEAIVAMHGSRDSWTIRELAAAVGVGVDTVRQVGREAGLTFQRVLPRSAFRADSPENLANAERVKAALRTHGHLPLRELALVLGTSTKQTSRYRLRWLRVVEHAAAQESETHP